MLEINNLSAGYGAGDILKELSLSVPSGKVAVVMGRNGAGKSTLLRAVMGFAHSTHGTMRFDGVRLADLPVHRRAALGIGYVPQGRRLFANLSVMENIAIGISAGGERSDSQKSEIYEWLFSLFPALKEARKRISANLSGGEQQMLATARALALRPSLLLLDEPSDGLQPSLIDSVIALIHRLKREKVAILLVEQRTDIALATADSLTFLANGKTQETLRNKKQFNDTERLHRYLGI